MKLYAYSDIQTIQPPSIPNGSDDAFLLESLRKLRIYYHNVGGMRSKLPDIYSASSLSEYDVIMISETWLLNDVLDSELFDSNWSVYRRDRFESTTAGGGVILAIRNAIPNSRVDFDVPSEIDQVWAKLLIHEKSIYLSCIYIPPSSPNELFDAHLEAIDRVLNLLDVHDNVFIAGDFNIPNLKWLPDDENSNVLIPSGTDESEIKVADHMSLNDLRQVSCVANDNSRHLDLIFTDQYDGVLVSAASVTLCRRFLNTRHHKAIEMTVLIHDSPKSVGVKEQFYDFYGADYSLVNEELNLIDWSFLYSDSELDVKLEQFYSTISLQCTV